MLIHNETEMLAQGARLAKLSEHPFINYLSGPLGAGKTTFSRGFLQGMGHQGRVKSPSYNLVEPYCMEGVDIFHFDFYRIQNPQELEWIGIREYFHPRAVCLIEWPEYGSESIPSPDLLCTFEILNEQRKLTVCPHSERGDKIIKRLA